MKQIFSTQQNTCTSTRRNRGITATCSLLTALVLFCLLMPTTWAADKTAEPTDDVRVLFDISGSMKRTDAYNLRRPALRLFTSLLPKGANSGVWTFGQWTNMLVKHGPVNTAWKDKARKAADEISSRGLRTNIEDVLRRATWDWKSPDKDQRRSLILLTDGLVDVSKDAAENTASRARILDEILPRLQQAGVTVHTIALSSESDTPLLEQLAAATGGWFETIETADGLERLFLRMFEKVSKTDTLPLIGNKVSIDNSIHETTFLVFRKPGTPATTITSPEGKNFGQKKLPAGVEWHADERYDLITVQDPAPGEWTINADVDPDNRVMVVTDLHMKNTELPNDLSADRPLLFTLQLEQEGKIIDRPDFLQFVTATLTQVSNNGEEQKWRLRDDGKHADLTANDGIFSTRLDKSLVEGEYEFILDMDGTTFKRNQRQSAKVYGAPVNAQLAPLGHGRYALTIVPYASLIDTNTLKIDIEHVLPDGRLETAKVPQASPAEWRLELDASGNAGKHELMAHITGQRTDGSALDMQLGPILFEANDDAAPQPREPMRAAQPEQPDSAVQEEIPAEPVPDTPPPEEPAEPEQPAGNENPPQVSWGLIIGSIFGLTTLLAGMVFGGIKLWPKFQAWRNQKKEAAASAEEKQETPPPAAPKPPTEEPPAPEPQSEPETDGPDVDKAIDELLGETELNPELDLGAELVLGADDTEEFDITETSNEDTQEIAEIPDDLLSLGDDVNEDTDRKDNTDDKKA